MASYGNDTASLLNVNPSPSTLPLVNSTYLNFSSTNWVTWIIVIFVLALFGVNVFGYLAKGTEDATSVFKPMFDLILALVAHVTAFFVGITASGTKTIVSNTADVIDTGLSEIENTAANIQDKTSPSSLKSQTQRDTTMDDNTLNQALDTHTSNDGPYAADDSGSSIQSGNGKSGWCFIGEDRQFRSCMEIGQQDVCMTGDIFPSQEICVNPSLRA